VAPAIRVNWLFTVGLLPALVREQYGFAWNARHERALERWTKLLRVTRHWLPERAALWPESRS
jgi:uncharacterized protein (DUF2236 family)